MTTGTFPPSNLKDIDEQRVALIQKSYAPGSMHDCTLLAQSRAAYPRHILKDEMRAD